MRSVLLAALFAVAALTQMVRADGLVYQLPADGAQVRYDMELTPMVAGQDVVVKGLVSVSSVGKATVDNEKCRWIEIKMITNDGGQERPVITKALIPEKHLGKGKSAAENIIRLYLKEGDGEIQEIKDFKAPPLSAMRAFLAGPPKNPGELDKVEIDGKLGKLQCAGITGDAEFDIENATLDIHVENRLHEKSPFGVVNAAWKFEIKNNGQVALAGTFKLTVADTNTTALSELPNNN